MSWEIEEAGVEADRLPANQTICMQIVRRADFSRKEFLRELLGKALTLAIAIAHTAGHSRTVDDLLRIKDRFHRRQL